MNPKDIRTWSDKDPAGSNAACRREAHSAEDLALKTNTSMVIGMDGKEYGVTQTAQTKSYALKPNGALRR
jgi:hypothetical protein